MIITNTDLLTKECKNISILEASSVINQLELELKTSKIPGVGLAANQIGIDAKVCIIRAKDKINLVNPVIIEKFDLMEFYNEGCLSFPEKWVTTKRYNEVFVKDDLHPAGIVCTGFEAVVVQHEVSHLYGETMFNYQIPSSMLPNDHCWCGSKKKYKKCHMGKKIMPM